MGIGFPELLVIFLLVLLLFGAKRLPEIAGAMGRAVNEFKNAKDSPIKSEAQPQLINNCADTKPNKHADDKDQ